MLGPIFAREFLTVPRRDSHYFARATAVGLLWTLGVTAWLATHGLGREPLLGAEARLGRLVFQLYCLVILALVVFFAAVTAASAVAREKDRRTFVLLLITDLTGREIVLGKLLGSLLPIALLILGALPVLAVLLVLGGMTPGQVVRAWLVIVAAAAAAGSFGGLIALWRDRTFQAIALGLLGLMLYFGGVRTIAGIGAAFVPDADWSARLAGVDPFQALLYVIEPEADAVYRPEWGFIAWAIGLTIGLNALGVWKLRVWNPGREAIQQRETPDEESLDAAKRLQAHAAPGPVRSVRGNPILWREVFTRAYGRRPLVVKLAYFAVVGLIAYGVFAEGASRHVAFAAAYGLLPVTFLSLLLVTAQSATAITTERDVGALDLLLVTDLTPNEFIFGKLLGVAYNVKEFLLPPLLLAGVYAALGMLATPPRDALHELTVRNVQSMFAVGGGLLVLMAFVLIFGVFVALRVANSRTAILQAIGTVFFLSVGTLVCIYLILVNGGSFEYQFLSFSLFLMAGIGGLLWVLSAELPSAALTLASVLMPLAVFYTVTNVLVANPGSSESAAPLVPFLVIAGSFGFTIAGMLVPLLSEFDVALGRTRAAE